MLIPNEERYIGTTFDENSEVRTFRISRYTQTDIDLSAFTAKADIFHCDTETTDRADLEMEVQAKYILLHLYITAGMVATPGTRLIDLKLFNDDGEVKWSSYKGAFYVEDPFVTPSATSENLSELEQLEARINRAIEKAYDRAAEVAGEWLENNIQAIEGYVIDKDLETENAAADAKATGDAIAHLKDLVSFDPVNIRLHYDLLEDDNDVTAQVQELENAGRDIYFPNGIYRIGRFTKKNSSWYGAGDKTVIIFSDCSANEYAGTSGLVAFDDSATGAGDLWRGTYLGGGYNSFTLANFRMQADNSAKKEAADFLLLAGTKNVVIDHITFDMGKTYELTKGYWVLNFAGENYDTIVRDCRMYCDSQTEGENGNLVIAQAVCGNIEGFEVCGNYFEINDTPDETIWIAGATHHAKNIYVHDNVFNSLKGSTSPIVRYVNGRNENNYISGAIKNNYFTGVLGTRFCIQVGVSISSDTLTEGAGFAFVEVGSNVANHISGDGGFISVVNGSFTAFANSAVNCTFARAFACAGNGVAAFTGNVLKSVTCTGAVFTSNLYDYETKGITVSLDHEDYGMYSSGGIRMTKDGSISNSRFSFGAMVGEHSIRNDFGTLVINNSTFVFPYNAPAGAVHAIKASGCNFTQFSFRVLGENGEVTLVNSEFHNDGVGIVTFGGTVTVKDCILECAGSANPVFQSAAERKAAINTLFIVDDAVTVPGSFAFWKDILRYNGSAYSAVADHV